MTDSRQTPDSAEDQLLQHFRQQATVEPPARLDSLILAAARRETPAPKPTLWQRWLQTCQRPRWQLAFASLFGIALILALVQRLPEQQPKYDAAPEPKMSTLSSAKRQAAPAAESMPQPIQSAPAGALSAPAPAPAAPMASFAMPAQTESLSAETQPKASKPMADEAKAKVSKRSAEPAKTLDEELQEVLRLRGLGRVKAADAQLAALHKRFPKDDLAARLKQLQEQ